MSLLELIAQRNSGDIRSFSLPDFMAEQALVSLASPADAPENLQISRRFAVSLLSPNVSDAQAFADALLAHGVSERRFLLSYVAGAADVLGTGWGDDTLSFAQVTDAMGRLTEVARERMSAPPLEAFLKPHQPRILMIRPPGEDHTMGMLLMTQIMRKRGWLVRVDLSGDADSITAGLLAQDFDMVGLSVATESALDGLRDTIDTSQKHNPDAKTVLGGWLVGDNESLLRQTGANLVLSREKDAESEISALLQLEAE